MVVAVLDGVRTSRKASHHRRVVASARTRCTRRDLTLRGVDAARMRKRFRMPMAGSLREFLESSVDDDDLRVGGSVDEAAILRAEAALDLKFPDDYRRFVAEVGWVQIFNSYFFGVPTTEGAEEGSVVAMTRYARERWSAPADCLVVYSSNDQVLWCIRPANDSKVIAFDTRRTMFTGTVASSFLAALENFVVG
jgi:hypothetical protein